MRAVDNDGLFLSSYHENSNRCDGNRANSCLDCSYNYNPIPAKLREKMVAEDIRKKSIAKHGEDKREEPRPTTKETYQALVIGYT
jgi:hypothetical protein